MFARSPRRRPPKVNPHVAAISPTQARKRLSERREARLPHGIVFVIRHEHADTPYAVALLRPRRERPRRRAAEERDELAPPKANAHLALLCGPVDQAGEARFAAERRLPPPHATLASRRPAAALPGAHRLIAPAL